MAAYDPPPQPQNPYPMRKLLLLTAVVALVHALLLWAVPVNGPMFSGQPEGLLPQARATGFVTRSVAQAPPGTPDFVALEPVTPRPPPRPAALAKATPAVKPKSVPPSEELAVTPSSAPEPTPDTAPVSVQMAAATPGETSVKTRAEAATGTRNPASTPAGASGNAASPPKLVYPAPVRLLYEGKGEEKGFLKYTAAGELVWAPDGTQYNAKLEITFLLARLRTWTSRGELGDSGLQPTRFGDKPRGAELATHFQRDKGIISFSANNPDVPLQPGAQDKLSALVQLGALMAGAPGRYGPGSVISFQAADAHRAELWDFKVGASEALELPGGSVNAIKLSKEPTAEFDQRIEVWLAPDRGYLPVRLRITEANSAFVDLLWRKTEKPE